jgi:hypothetical protein
MPKFSLSKEAIEGKPTVKGGVYEFRLDGFKPAKAKSGTSVNLNPDLKVINDPNFTDSKIFASLNEGFPPAVIGLVHALGMEMVPNADSGMDIPGDFQGGADPKTWSYVGPLVGRSGRVELQETERTDGKPGTRTEIKRFICALPGCQEKHPETYIKS